jgi:hypothetical protein
MTTGVRGSAPAPARERTVSHTRSIAPASSTDVPPNFKTSMMTSSTFQNCYER